jgi:hypothetical protein
MVTETTAAERLLSPRSRNRPVAETICLADLERSTEVQDSLHILTDSNNSGLSVITLLGLLSHSNYPIDKAFIAYTTQPPA